VTENLVVTENQIVTENQTESVSLASLIQSSLLLQYRMNYWMIMRGILSGDWARCGVGDGGGYWLAGPGN